MENLFYVEQTVFCRVLNGFNNVRDEWIACRYAQNSSIHKANCNYSRLKPKNTVTISINQQNIAKNQAKRAVSKEKYGKMIEKRDKSTHQEYAIKFKI